MSEPEKPSAGGPAFPRIGHVQPDDVQPEAWLKGHPGMPLRAHLAGQALSGVLLAVSMKHLAAQLAGDKEAETELNAAFTEAGIATGAVGLADALIAELEKPR